MNKEPEFLICHNKDDVEEAFDPFADSQDFPQVKQEYVDSYFGNDEKNELIVGDIKGEREVESDYDNFGNDNFDELISTPKIELIELDNASKRLEAKCTSKISDRLNSSSSSIRECKPNIEPEANAKKTIKVKETTKDKKPAKTARGQRRQKIQKKNAKPKSTGGKKVKPKKEHKCQFCDKCFVYAKELKRHTTTHVADKGHTCPVCGKSFSRADYREHHINSAHKGEVVDGVLRKPTYEQMCEICSKVFHHSSSFRKHMILHSGERPFSCTECGKTFAWHQHLKSHMKIHSDEKSYQCSLCGKLFKQKSNYQKHMRIHTGEKPYQCEICQKQFAQSSNYQVHMRVHLNVRPHKCDECDKSFVQAINLTKHKRVHQNDDNVVQQFKCTDCEKTFTFNHQLVEHRRIHTGERPYQCDKCGARFTSTTMLKRHVKKRHEEDMENKDEKPEELIKTCPECHKTFGNKHLLATHMKIHSGIKPFKCDYCEKCFIAKFECKKHMRVHTGEKPFQCEICQKQFTFSNSYRIHMRNHAGDKPFQCQYCDRAFSSSSDRAKHIKVHTKNSLE